MWVGAASCEPRLSAKHHIVLKFHKGRQKRFAGITILGLRCQASAIYTERVAGTSRTALALDPTCHNGEGREATAHLPTQPHDIN